MRDLLKGIAVFCVGLVTLNVYANSSNSIQTKVTATGVNTGATDIAGLALNQSYLQSGQNDLAQSQYFMNENNKTWLQNALTESQASD